MKWPVDVAKSAARWTAIPHDELPESVDPCSCLGCVEAGSSCDFHLGFSQGWDFCAAFMAGAVEAVNGHG